MPADERCPTCNSPKPQLHPAVQFEGEVQICRDPWHSPMPADERAPRIAQRLECLNAAGKGGEFPPYTEDEQRVCDYLLSLNGDMGCGADPIGFLIASHGYNAHMCKEALKEADRRAREDACHVVDRMKDRGISGMLEFSPRNLILAEVETAIRASITTAEGEP